MKNFPLLVTLLASTALALPGTVPAQVQLVSKPGGKVVTTLPAGTALEVRACTGGSTGWCEVTTEKVAGYLPRAKIKAKGACPALRAIGFDNIKRGEASYNGQRDRDGDGVGCDQ